MPTKRMLNHNRQTMEIKENVIAEYLEKREFRNSLPGRIVNGIMEVFFEGQWMAGETFNKVFPPVKLPSLTVNLNNIDTTRLWMHT